jgi:hypothetical protein
MTLNQWFDEARRGETEYTKLVERLRRPQRRTVGTVLGMLVSFLF